MVNVRKVRDTSPSCVSFSPLPPCQAAAMSRSLDSEDGCLVAMDTSEEGGAGPAADTSVSMKEVSGGAAGVGVATGTSAVGREGVNSVVTSGSSTQTEEQNGQTMTHDEEEDAYEDGYGGLSQRAMVELPEEVLEYILSFLSPYQEHKTAALVCKQWYRLIKGQWACVVVKKTSRDIMWKCL